MPADAHTIVIDTVGRLQRALLGRDVQAAVDCFVPDGALFGTGLHEDAHGHEELVRTFEALVDRGLCPEWEIDRCHVHVHDGAISFVADALVIVTVLGRRSRHRRFRLSGSLRGATTYRFELFNGLEPLLGSGSGPHLVG